MADQPTCGQGLAEHSALPTKIAELMSARADNLEVHTGTLVLSDEKAERSNAAYIKLAAEHRRIATELHDTGVEMAGYRDLPMGAHDEEALCHRRSSRPSSGSSVRSVSLLRCSASASRASRRCSMRWAGRTGRAEHASGSG